MNLAEWVVYKYAPASNPSLSGEVTLVCPECRYTNARGEGKLAFSTARGAGQCFRCGWTCNTLKLARAAGLELPVGKRFDTKLRPSSHVPDPSPKARLNPLALWDDLLGNDNFLARRARAYLQDRGFSCQMMEEYKVGIGTSDRLVGRIVFPIYEGPEVVYYQARTFTGQEPKYLNPSRRDGLRGKAEVVAFLDEVHEGEPCVLAEGFLSAIGASKVLGMPGVAILGKSLSMDQLYKLVSKKPSAVVIWLDPDTTPGEARSLSLAFTSWGIPTRLHPTNEEVDPWDSWQLQQTQQRR